jgi:hypothetical protein
MPSAIEPIIINGSAPRIKIKSPAPQQQPFRLMDLPAEVRLKIYEAYLDTAHPYLNRRLVLIGKRGSSFTSRSKYRALGINPVWEGGNGRLATLLTLNRQIYTEAAHHFYTQFTFLFANSFCPERAGTFLATLSHVVRTRIRHIGFEIVFSVHMDEVMPKQKLALYQEVPGLLPEVLPGLRSVLLYLNPIAYLPCDREGAERGVLQLARFFGVMGTEVKFLPVEAMNREVIEKAEREMMRHAGGLQEQIELTPEDVPESIEVDRV